jgi:hypothetical protein
MDSFDERVSSLSEMVSVLMKDIKTLIGRSKKPMSQPKRRSLVRAVFALIEADTFARKQFALFFHDAGGPQFSLAELALLREEQYDLGGKGEARTQIKFLRTADNFQFGIRSFCKAAKIDYEIPKARIEWQAFLQSIKVRNRITHPKNLSELLVSDTDIQKLQDTIELFKEILMEISHQMSHLYLIKSLH